MAEISVTGQSFAAVGATGIPIVAQIAIVQTKAVWSDPWKYQPDLEFLGATFSSAGQASGTARIRRRYGSVMHPYETSFTTRDPELYLRHWVRILIVDQFGGTFLAWQGQILGEQKDVHATGHGASDNYSSGEQILLAWHPVALLDRVVISRSFWNDGVNPEKDLGWIPPMNGRDAHRLLIGNRSDAASGDTFVYGGTSVWTHLEYVEYVLERFMETATGPKWRVGGARGALDDIETDTSFGPAASVGSILTQLIPTRFGLDFLVQPWDDGTDAGYEVYIFSLNAEDISFGDITLPRNPFTMRIDSPRPREMESVRVVASGEHEYDRVRVVGQRIISCFSLDATLGTPTLVPKWTAGQEAAYKAGIPGIFGGDAAQRHDEYRAVDVFRTVYQQFGAPDDWDWNGGEAAPLLDLLGQLDSGSAAEYQLTVRRTLPFVPLREGVDYSDPENPVDLNPTDHVADFMPPMAFLKTDLTDRYLPADRAGFSVSVPANDWGVFVQGFPNHALALNHWSGAQPTQFEPRLDWEEMVTTIAVETDQRFEIGIDVGSSPVAEDGSIQTIFVPDAEYWFLADDTVTAAGEDGLLVRTTAPVILRDDTDRLALAMAGAIARYWNFRGRTEIVIRGLVGYTDAVGLMLTVIDEGGWTNFVNAAVTSVEYVNGPEPKTIIRAGFAQ